MWFREHYQFIWRASGGPGARGRRAATINHLLACPRCSREGPQVYRRNIVAGLGCRLPGVRRGALGARSQKPEASSRR